MDTLFVIGRSLPTAEDVTWRVEALTGRPFRDDMDPAIETKRLKRSEGGLAEVTDRTDGYDDPLAQAVLQSIRDDEIQQALHRARPVNRGVENPVRIVVLSNAVVEEPVETAEPWASIARPTPVERMWASTGFATASPKTAARLAPEVWATEKAATRAFEKQPATGPLVPYKRIYGSGGPVRARIRRPRSRTAVDVLVDPRRHPDPRTALEERLGPLAECELVWPEADRPADRRVEPEAAFRRPRRHVLRAEPAVLRMATGEHRLQAA